VKEHLPGTEGPVTGAAASHLLQSRRKWLRQFFSFAGIGLIATAIQYGVLIGAVELLRVSPVVGSTAGFAISAVTNYILNYYYTFRSTRSHMSAAARFAVIAFIGLLINGVIMAALTQWLRVPYILAQLTATAVVFVWTFLGNARWSFAHTAVEVAKSKSEASR
jgi:putative flippase GtrA